MKLLKILVVLVLVATLVVGGTLFWGWSQLHEPFGSGEEVSYVVSSGASATRVLEDLEREGVLASARLARLWLIYGLGDPAIHAGEYRFERGKSIVGVLDQLIEGDVVQHQVTVIEGLTYEETADALAAAGFGDRDAFVAAMEDPSPIADWDPEAEDLEGYLFPETYSFPGGTSEAQIVHAMVQTFRDRFDAEIRPLLDQQRATESATEAERVAIHPGGGAAVDAEKLDQALAQDAGEAAEEDAAGTTDDDTLDLRQLVILASIVEKEAGATDERPMVASVYSNRLERGMGLYADPTVIYALKKQGTWDGNIRREDLQMDSPYNTYRYRGLPPSPIASPGLASLRAAARPTDTPYLYFVSRNDGTHVFAETYAEHQKNVERWQRRYWRERRAAEVPGEAEEGGAGAD